VPAGYFTSVPASTSYKQNPCSPGAYCPAGSTSGTANLCPAGTYRTLTGGTAVTDCAQCPTGHYCPPQNVEPYQCPLGYYCPNGIEDPLPCPIGTFGASLGLRSLAECTPCWSGRYCSQTGLSMPDGLCDPGFYCISGAYTAAPTDGVTGNVCPAGGFCVKGSSYAKNCPAGYYNPTPGKSKASDCILCPAGKYCSGSNTASPAAPTGSCFAGYYCTSGATVPTQFTA